MHDLSCVFRIVKNLSRERDGNNLHRERTCDLKQWLMIEYLHTGVHGQKFVGEGWHLGTEAIAFCHRV